MKHDILIVEDNSINQIILSKSLVMSGYNVLVVDNPFDAIETLKNLIFDLAIIDIQMANMDGVQLARVIKSMNIDIPLIACTGFNINEMHISEVAFFLLFKAIVRKPYEIKDLKTTIAKYLSAR